MFITDQLFFNNREVKRVRSIDGTLNRMKNTQAIWAIEKHYQSKNEFFNLIIRKYSQLFCYFQRAAYQFGVKMGDGRKTRNKPGDTKNEKNKLDKEWSQISKLIDKRKAGDFGSLGGKKPKY